MKTSLQFDFKVNKEAKTINVKKEFDGSKDLVWDCWTKPEYLDQWWAPKPYRVETKSMDFSEGGTWYYAMISPENEAHHCRADYKTIKTQENFSYSDAFTDENGNINEQMPSMNWNVDFENSNEKTLVNVLLTFETLEDLEGIIEMGFKEGFTAGLDNLDELLKTLNP